jgi:hypothetical protein
VDAARRRPFPLSLSPPARTRSRPSRSSRAPRSTSRIYRQSAALHKRPGPATASAAGKQDTRSHALAAAAGRTVSHWRGALLRAVRPLVTGSETKMRPCRYCPFTAPSALQAAQQPACTDRVGVSVSSGNAMFANVHAPEAGALRPATVDSISCARRHNYDCRAQLKPCWEPPPPVRQCRAMPC